jgi:hypothetical protein
MCGESSKIPRATANDFGNPQARVQFLTCAPRAELEFGGSKIAGTHFSDRKDI